MTIEKLRAEQEKLKKAIDRRRKQNAADDHKYYEIERQIERLKLVPLIGVEAGVQYAFRRASHEKDAWLNDALGTLLKINRKYAVVDYGDRGTWNIVFCRLQPAGERQGGTIAALASGEWI